MPSVKETLKVHCNLATHLCSNIGARLVCLRYGGEGLGYGLLDGGLAPLVLLYDLPDAGGHGAGAYARCQQPH
jgi:hypothetical protein